MLCNPLLSKIGGIADPDPSISRVLGREGAGALDEVALVCCPDYSRRSSGWAAMSTVGGPTNG
jgi:hypothetical protein